MESIRFFTLNLVNKVQIFSDLESRLVRLKRLMSFEGEVGFGLEDIFLQVRVIQGIESDE